MKELFEIQSRIKVAKDLRNEFGKYNYRSAETILSAVKPLLNEFKCVLNMTEDIVLIGDRFYVKSTVSLINEAGEVESSTSFAREEDTKKGMDASQITGSSISYCRKYALGGLFAIDDGKDADSLNTTPEYTAIYFANGNPVVVPTPKVAGSMPLKEQHEKYTQQNLNEVTVLGDLRKIWDAFPQLHNYQDFIDALSDCKIQNNWT